MSTIKCITLEEELKKNLELKISDINILREWCEKQPHLPKIQDVELAVFLHSNYYHLEPTKNTIENYYTYRTHIPELFSNRDLHNMQLRDSFKVAGMVPLEGKTKEEYSMIVAHLIDTDPSHFYINELFTAALMIYDEILWTHGSKSGCVVVIDTMGIKIGHIRHLNLTLIKKFISYVQDALPIRLKGIHIMNTSLVIKMLWNIVKPFVNDSLINLVHFHSTVESASEYFPIDALPNELGGKAGAIEELMDAEFKMIENFREWFLEDEKNNRVNESLRIDKSTICSDLLGVDSSFKTIEFD